MSESVSLEGPWIVRADPEWVGVERRFWMIFDWWSEEGAMIVPGSWSPPGKAGVGGFAWLGRVARLPVGWAAAGPQAARVRLRIECAGRFVGLWVNGLEVRAAPRRSTGSIIELDVTEAAFSAPGACPLPPYGKRDINLSIQLEPEGPVRVDQARLVLE